MTYKCQHLFFPVINVPYLTYFLFFFLTYEILWSFGVIFFPLQVVAPPQFGFAQDVIASAPPSYAELNPTPQVGAKFSSLSNYLCLIIALKLLPLL